MAIRVIRHLADKVCEVEDTNVLSYFYLGQGERVEGGSGIVHASSLPIEGSRGSSTPWSYIGSWGVLEYNHYVIAVPWSVFTAWGGDEDEDGFATNFGVPLNAAQVQAFWRKLVLEFGTDGSEFFGANADGSGAMYDPVQGMWLRRPARTAAQATAADAAPSENIEATQASDDPLLFGALTGIGPSGILRLHTHEALLSSQAISSIGINVPNLVQLIPVIGKFFQAAGVNDFTFRDEYTWEVQEPLMGPAVVISGIVRYQVGASPGNAWTTMDAAKMQLIRAFVTGDQQVIKSALLMRTDPAADWLRSVLFGGDYDVEGIPDVSGRNTNTFPEILKALYTGAAIKKRALTSLRPNDMAFVEKCKFGIETPYSLRL